MAFDPMSLIGAGIGAVANLFGGKLSGDRNEEARNLEAQRQREFAQSGIQWKVKDAEAAGIHPLYALGANTVSYAPQSVGETNLGTGIASAGQDISRAMQATQTKEGRETAYTKTIQDMSVQKMGLENEMLAAQIAKLKGPALPPPFPGPIQTGAKPDETRHYQLSEGTSIHTNRNETKQDELSKEYGDEGLPQLPGQLRFARDFLNSQAARANGYFFPNGKVDLPGYLASLPAEYRQAIGAYLTTKRSGNSTWRPYRRPGHGSGY